MVFRQDAGWAAEHKKANAEDRTKRMHSAGCFHAESTVGFLVSENLTDRPGIYA